MALNRYFLNNGGIENPKWVWNELDYEMLLIMKRGLKSEANNLRYNLNSLFLTISQENTHEQNAQIQKQLQFIQDQLNKINDMIFEIENVRGLRGIDQINDYL
jgi:CHAD domain-containing protein